MKRFPILLIILFTFLAVSCQEKMYTVTYVQNDGNSNLSEVAMARHVTSSSNKPMVLATSNDFGNRNDGRKLLMWSTRPDDTKRDGSPRSQDEILQPESIEDKNFPPSSLYNLRQNITLYAIWTDSRALVKFDANGGKFNDETTEKSFVKVFEVPYTIPSETDPNSLVYNISRTGYRFMGWSEKQYSDGDRIDMDKMYNTGETYTKEGANTLYAVWGTNHVMVKYNLNEESVRKRVEARDDGGVFYGKAAFYPGEDNIAFLSLNNQGKGVTINRPPTLEGCTFEGWSTKPNAEPGSSDIEYLPYMYDGADLDGLKYYKSEDLVLYAIWTENQFTYTFDLSKKDEDGIALNTQAETNFTAFEEGHTTHVKYYYTPLITKTTSEVHSSILAPSCEGYDFTGWTVTDEYDNVDKVYRASSDNTRYTLNTKISTNKSLKLRANWKEKTIEVNLKFQNGTSYNVQTSNTAYTPKNISPDRSYTYKYWDFKNNYATRSYDTSADTVPTSKSFKFKKYTLSKTYDSTKVVDTSNIALSKWFTGSSPIYSGDSSKPCRKYDATLYAQWDPDMVTLKVNYLVSDRLLNNYLAKVTQFVNSNFPGGYVNEGNGIYSYYDYKICEAIISNLVVGSNYDIRLLGYKYVGWNKPLNETNYLSLFKKADGSSLSNGKGTKNTYYLDSYTKYSLNFNHPTNASIQVEKWKIETQNYDSTFNVRIGSCSYNSFSEKYSLILSSAVYGDIFKRAKYIINLYDSYYKDNNDNETLRILPYGLLDYTKTVSNTRSIDENLVNFLGYSTSSTGTAINVAGNSTKKLFADLSMTKKSDDLYEITLYSRWEPKYVASSINSLPKTSEIMGYGPVVSLLIKSPEIHGKLNTYKDYRAFYTSDITYHSFGHYIIDGNFSNVYDIVSIDRTNKRCNCYKELYYCAWDDNKYCCFIFNPNDSLTIDY